MLGGGAQLIDDVLELARRSVEHIDLGSHHGVHPRLGAIDVVPFVPLGSATIEDAEDLRDHAASRLAQELGLPCFLYGPDVDDVGRTLPEIRRRAFDDLGPDVGPAIPRHHAGAVAVGARLPLVAWNVWIEGLDLATTRAIAASARSKGVRTLGLQVGDATQVSCNLIDPVDETPAMVIDRCRPAIERAGGTIARTELVGLAPLACLEAVGPDRLEETDLSEERTIEAACARLGVAIV